MVIPLNLDRSPGLLHFELPLEYDRLSDPSDWIGKRSGSHEKNRVE